MVQTSPTPFDVGRAFVHQYYTLLHQAPNLLHRFYSTDSTFIHGGVDRPGSVEQPAVGPENISRRITDLNLRDCHAKIRQVDSHPTIGNGVVVQVTGELSNNGDPMRRFMQTFVLAPRQPKKYYVQNDIFRYQDEVFDDGSDEVDEDDRSSSHIYGDTISNVDKVSNADSSAAVLASQQPLLVTANTRATMPEQQQPLPPRTNGPVMASNHTQVIPTQVSRPQEHQHSDSTNLNGFSTGAINESTNYGSLGHGHQPSGQETASTHAQPSPRPNSHPMAPESQAQSNGGSVVNQQQQQQQQPPTTKQTGQTQQPSTSTTETPRSEGPSYAGIAKLNSSTGVTQPTSSTGLPSTSTARVSSVPTGTPTNVAPQQSNAVRPPVKTATTANGRPSNNPQSGPNNYTQGRGGNNNYHQQNNRGPNVGTAPNENQVFVGSLPPEFTPETLTDFFSKYGRVVDAKIHHANGDNKKNFGFVVFENPGIASQLVAEAHVNYNDSIRLNIEAKTPRNNSSNNNIGGNYSNGPQGGGRPGVFVPRGGRGGNRGPYRGGSNNPRRGGGQYNPNTVSFTASDDMNNEYRTNKAQQQTQ